MLIKAVVLLALALCGVVAYMYRRGGVYSNKVRRCATARGFCGLRAFRNALPRGAKRDLLALFPLAKRVDVPGWKAGRTVPTGVIAARAPAVIEWYARFADRVSEVVGTKVFPTSLDLPTSCSLLVYDRAGDFINWHFDVNYFRGRFFTVLLPVTARKTCTKFVYRDAAARVRTLEGKTVVFEGDELFHKASKLCAGQTRAVLSLQYSTDPRISWVESWLMCLKDFAYVGI